MPLEPADALRSRLYREFRMGTMSVIEIRKVKSMLTQASPKLQRSVQLPGGLHLQFDKDAAPEITSTIHYDFGFRVLSYGWAGNFKFNDHDSEERLFPSLSDSQKYADEALWATVEHGQGQLGLFDKERYVDERKTGQPHQKRLEWGQALREALRQTHLEWRAPPSFIPREPEGKKRPSTPPPEPKRGREAKSDKRRTVSMIKGGKKRCKRFNDARGCATQSCPDLHVCDVKLPDGKPCMSRSHSRLCHRQEWRCSPLAPGWSVAHKKLDLGTWVPARWGSSTSPLHWSPGFSRLGTHWCSSATFWCGKKYVCSQTRLLARYAAMFLGFAPKGMLGWWLTYGGGLPLTLLSMGMHFYCLAAESDPAARQAVASSIAQHHPPRRYCAGPSPRLQAIPGSALTSRHFDRRWQPMSR